MTENEERITIGQLEELVNEQPNNTNIVQDIGVEHLNCNNDLDHGLGNDPIILNCNNINSNRDLDTLTSIPDTSLNSIKLTLDNDKQKNKLIEIIETFEVTNPKEAFRCNTITKNRKNSKLIKSIFTICTYWCYYDYSGL